MKDVKWQDMTNGKDGVTLLQFADRFSRVLYLTAMQYEVDGNYEVDDEEDESEGSEEICEMLTAVAMAVGQTVETFGPYGKELTQEELAEKIAMLDGENKDV